MTDPHSPDWIDGYQTGMAEGSSGVFRPDGSYKEPLEILWEAFHAAMQVFGDGSTEAHTVFEIHDAAEKRLGRSEDTKLKE